MLDKNCNTCRQIENIEHSCNCQACDIRFRYLEYHIIKLQNMISHYVLLNRIPSRKEMHEFLDVAIKEEEESKKIVDDLIYSLYIKTAPSITNKYGPSFEKEKKKEEERKEEKKESTINPFIERNASVEPLGSKSLYETIEDEEP